ncbi:hypothetical protein PROFUN_16865 [Planoprotostelium fungivorum]|uniref:Uncharacterized protein n=1 Tax=Planoprotostelium fungivorum TaxID=1890364 RepID=A0A2P6MNQ2_9EUKA|nr:hypothetical protein PROFUN_16865 [Planoprotostelium fungivorum]
MECPTQLTIKNVKKRSQPTFERKTRYCIPTDFPLPVAYVQFLFIPQTAVVLLNVFIPNPVYTRIEQKIRSDATNLNGAVSSSVHYSARLLSRFLHTEELDMQKQDRLVNL